MNRARVIRGLRIAVTALSLTACVLLVALWVTSYYALDKLMWSNTARTAAFGVISNRGRLVFGRFELGPGQGMLPPNNEVDAMLAAYPKFIVLNQELMRVQAILARGSLGPSDADQIQITIESIQGQIARYRGQIATQMMSQRRAVPHWLPLLLCAMLAAAPWIKWRFSLRALIIATAVVAMALGLAVARSQR